MPKRKKCFCADQCFNGECPNAQYEAADERWGYGIADDMGLGKIKCMQCIYNTGKCEDCSFEDTEYCKQTMI